MTYLTFKLAIRVAARRREAAARARGRARQAGRRPRRLTRCRRALTEARGLGSTGGSSGRPSSLQRRSPYSRSSQGPGGPRRRQGSSARRRNRQGRNLNLEDRRIDQGGRLRRGGVAKGRRRSVRAPVGDHRDDSPLKSCARWNIDELSRCSATTSTTARRCRGARAREAAMAAHGKYVRPSTARCRRRRRTCEPFSAEALLGHGYHEPGCGFFSYAHRLPPWSADDVGDAHPLRSTMDAYRVWPPPPLSRARGRRRRIGALRPPDGHQLHFDSDDEKGRVIRPVWPRSSSSPATSGSDAGDGPDGASKRLARRLARGAARGQSRCSGGTCTG